MTFVGTNSFNTHSNSVAIIPILSVREASHKMVKQLQKQGWMWELNPCKLSPKANLLALNVLFLMWVD